MNHLTQLLRVTCNQRRAGIKHQLHRRRSFSFAWVQLHNIGDKRVQIHRLQLRGGQARVVSELVDQSLHRIYLINDGFNGLGEQLLLNVI